MRSRFAWVACAIIVFGVGACNDKGGGSDKATTAGGPEKATTVPATKTCDDVGKNWLRISGTKLVGQQENVTTKWCLTPSEKLNQHDIDCLANAPDEEAFRKCRDDSPNHD
jgi:hypothetical protein